MCFALEFLRGVSEGIIANALTELLKDSAFWTVYRSTLSEPLRGSDSNGSRQRVCSGSDRGVRRKAQVFAADCGESMEIELKQPCNQLSSSIQAIAMKRSIPAHTASVWHNPASAAPAA